MKRWLVILCLAACVEPVMAESARRTSDIPILSQLMSLFKPTPVRRYGTHATRVTDPTRKRGTATVAPETVTPGETAPATSPETAQAPIPPAATAAAPETAPMPPASKEGRRTRRKAEAPATVTPVEAAPAVPPETAPTPPTATAAVSEPVPTSAKESRRAARRNSARSAAPANKPGPAAAPETAAAPPETPPAAVAAAEPDTTVAPPRSDKRSRKRTARADAPAIVPKPDDAPPVATETVAARPEAPQAANADTDLPPSARKGDKRPVRQRAADLDQPATRRDTPSLLDVLPDITASIPPILEPAPTHARDPRCGDGQRIVSAYYWEGRQTASGQPFDPYGMTAAHRTLPFGTRLTVLNPRNGRTVTVTINDRGPYTRGVSLDLSLGAAKAIGMQGTGVVCLL
jgi:rare lipoprotein A